MVKNLCESLGGRVWVESRAGGGTTFSILLPSSGSD
jgi:signal transduction histidine kinase